MTIIFFLRINVRINFAGIILILFKARVITFYVISLKKEKKKINSMTSKGTVVNAVALYTIPYSFRYIRWCRNHNLTSLLPTLPVTRNTWASLEHICIIVRKLHETSRTVIYCGGHVHMQDMWHGSTLALESANLHARMRARTSYIYTRRDG